MYTPSRRKELIRIYIGYENKPYKLHIQPLGTIKALRVIYFNDNNFFEESARYS